MSLPVHSAHVGQELEVYYRYHPYFSRKVLVRRIAQRATGQFLSVQGPAGIVVLIAGWMLDPVICAGMTIGAPGVDLVALVELKRLLIGLATPAHSQSDVGIVREESNEVSQIVPARSAPLYASMRRGSRETVAIGIICSNYVGWLKPASSTSMASIIRAGQTIGCSLA